MHKAGTIVILPSAGTTSTVIVPSKSNPKDPHIINVYPIGKCECNKNCPSYFAKGVCAHIITACFKMSKLPHFFRWIVAAKRKTRGGNYSRGVSFGMRKGRGRKGEVPPQKRKMRGKVMVSVQRSDTSSINYNPGPPR
jgi:hypothetical protein